MNQITLTPSAQDRIKEILSENDPGLNLRVFIQGGGCSGFQYGFTLDDKVNDDDITIDYGVVKLVVDMMSVQYMDGAVIDFTEDLTGSQFKITNPQAVSTCGCGASFTVG